MTLSNKIQFNPNKNKLAIGILSGTSVDGIDVALIKIKGFGTNSKIKLIDFKTYPYPEKIKKLILKNSDFRHSSVEDICRLNVIIGKLYADKILDLLKNNNSIPSQIEFIGSHGQTIYHAPNKKNFGGYFIKSTLQIGDPSVIANLTGITTVGDFRVADCAVGGDGAPLVPYFDYILFRSEKINRALLNIGGIANITVIPKGSQKNDIIAFDTGPGNMLLDGFTKRIFNKSFDKDSEFSSKGIKNDKLLNFLLKEPVYQKKPPKSTGRERYGKDFQDLLFKKFSRINKFDFLRTITEFTAYSIYYNYEKYVLPKVKIDELILSGGGANNPLLVDLIKMYFKDVKIKNFDVSGINADSKEAVLFAVLANECLGRESCKYAHCNRFK